MVTTTITCDECGENTGGYGANVTLVTSEMRKYWPANEPIRYGGKAPERFENVTRTKNYCVTCWGVLFNNPANDELVRLHNNPFPEVKYTKPIITQETIDAINKSKFICNACAADEEGECTEEGCVNYKESGATLFKGHSVPSCALGDETWNGTMYGWDKE